MAVTDHDPLDPLDRAAELARTDPAPAVAWAQTRDAVVRRVRATVRPGRPVAVPLTDAQGSRTWVNERVVVTGLRRGIAALDGVAPSQIRLALDGERCTGVDVEVVTRYGLDIQETGDRVRSRCREVLAGLLVEGAASVEVTVAAVDVTLDDPDL